MTERTVYLLRVDKVEQRSRDGMPLGWFVTCGSVTFGLGDDKPDLTVGDILELRKRKASP